MKRLLGSSEITRALINSSSTGIYMIQGGKFIYVSPLFTLQSGYSESEILGKKSLNFVYPEDREKVRQYAVACLKGLRDTPYEYRFIHKNGSILWILEKVASVDIKGKKAAVGSFMNITEYKKLEQAVEEQQKFMAQLLDSAPNPIMVAEIDTTIKYVNHSLQLMTGFSSSELVGKKIPYPFWTEECIPEASMMYQHLIESRGVIKKELLYKKKNGDKFWVEATVTIIGEPPLFISNWVDITQRKIFEEDLKVKANLLNEATDSIIVHDLAGNIKYANEAASRIRGLKQEDLMKYKFQDLLTPRDRWLYNEQMSSLIQKGSSVYEAENISKNGGIIPMEIHARLIESGNNKMVISIGRDITERKKTENELIYMATHDNLTGLPNRGLLNDRLEMALAQAARYKKKLVLMMLDLDNFKQVNDEFGHNIGDKLLKQVADRLLSQLRKTDTIARLGGDEFVIVLPEVDSVQDAENIANKVLRSFRKPFKINGNEINITTSIGIAFYPKDGEDIETLMRIADQNMYKAKHKGRDTYQFSAQYGLKI